MLIHEDTRKTYLHVSRNTSNCTFVMPFNETSKNHLFLNRHKRIALEKHS